MSRVIFLIFSLISLSLFAQHPNILVSDVNSPNEPAIAINYNNPKEFVAGTNMANYYTSVDGGLSWSEHVQKSKYGVWGDPVFLIDMEGNYFHFHLSNPEDGSWIDRIVSQKSTDGGKSFPIESYAGLNGKKAQDKHWVANNRKNNHLYLTWTQFDEYGSENPGDSTIIRFSKSVDGGESWSEAKRINEIAGDCLDGDNTVEGAVPAVGPNGELYVCWAGPLGLVMDKSLDDGETWLENDIHVDSMPGGWTFEIPGLYRANGMPVTKVDTSGGEFDGTVYVNWSDQRNGEDDTDIWLKKSTDGGETWSEIIRVNDDAPGKQQFFTWMDVDQSNGYLYFVFYDRRNYEDNQTDVYMAVSKDGGETIENFKISESPFNPDKSVFFGDYTNVVAYQGIVRPIWTRLDHKDLSILTAIVDTAAFGNDSILNIEYNTRLASENRLSFTIDETKEVSIFLEDDKENRVMNIQDSVFLNAGEHQYKFPAPFAKGIYYLTIEIDNKLLRRQLVNI